MVHGMMERAGNGAEREGRHGARSSGHVLRGTSCVGGVHRGCGGQRSKAHWIMLRHWPGTSWNNFLPRPVKHSVHSGSIKPRAHSLAWVSRGFKIKHWPGTPVELGISGNLGASVKLGTSWKLGTSVNLSTSVNLILGNKHQVSSWCT